MLITAILLFWIGAQLNAPLWYFLLLALHIIAEIFNIGVEIGERGEGDDS